MRGTASTAPTKSATYSQRVRRSPMRTASVFFPARVSLGMSRRLFTTRRAVARKPTGTAVANASHVRSSLWTNAEPTVATRPKNTNTNSSPKP
jgi:hypothetical protein